MVDWLNLGRSLLGPHGFSGLSEDLIDTSEPLDAETFGGVRIFGVPGAARYGRSSGGDIMVNRDPQTGQFVAETQQGKPVERLNRTMLAANSTNDTSPALDGWQNDNSGEGQWKHFEIEVPEGHLLLIYGVRTYIGDMNEIVAGNPVDVWYYNGHIEPRGNWTSKMVYDEFMAFHEYAVHSGGVDNAPTAALYPSNLATNFVQEYGFPEVSATGDITVQHEYLGGDHGEIAFEVLYEYVEVDSDTLIMELLGRR